MRPARAYSEYGPGSILADLFYLAANLRQAEKARIQSQVSHCDNYGETPAHQPKWFAERVGLIRSLRELTLRAACGCLSRGRAALGSNPGGFVHTRLTGRYKKGPLGALFISTGGEGGIRTHDTGLPYT